MTLKNIVLSLVGKSPEQIHSREQNELSRLDREISDLNEQVVAAIENGNPERQYISQALGILTAQREQYRESYQK